MRFISILRSIALFFFVLFLLVSPLQIFAQTQPVINEFSVHPSSGNKEWVELYSLDKTDLSTYWIDDDANFSEDSGSGAKKRLSDIAPGKSEHYYVVEFSSLFNNDGDVVALFDEKGTLLDQITYTSDPGADMTIGRYPDGTGSFQFLEKASKTDTNSSPLPEDTTTPEPTVNQSSLPSTATIGRSTNTGSSDGDSEIVSTTPGISSSLSNPKKSSTNIYLKDYPTPILGTSSAQKASGSAKKQDKKGIQKKKILVKDAQGKNPAVISAMVSGGILFIACGILIFLRKRRNL